MRSSFIAITAAAVIAGIFVFLTDPIAGANNSVTQPAVKGDRLDLNPEDRCQIARESPYYGNGCVRSRTLPTQRPSEGRIVIVNLWLIDLSAPAVSA